MRKRRISGEPIREENPAYSITHVPVESHVAKLHFVGITGDDSHELTIDPQII